MITGFHDLKNVLQGSVDHGDYGDDEIELEAESEDFPDYLELDLFQQVTWEFQSKDGAGPEVFKSLACLADNVLKQKLELTDKLFEQHLLPKYVEYVNTPQINNSVWVILPHATKRNDVNLQTIQKKFLNSAVSIMKVMEQLNDAREDPSCLDLGNLVWVLTDSLAFLGAANVDMVSLRRSCVKKDLPANMQLLCSDSVDSPGDLLFAKSLSIDIKEVSELNKISETFRGVSRPTLFRVRSFSRAAIRGQSWRYSRIRGGRVTKPSTSKRGISSFKRGPLNRLRPSTH